MKSLDLAGFLALLPLAFGPLPAPQSSFSVGLCNGGQIGIPFERNDDPAIPCAEKGCHAGSCRKKLDPAQRRAG